MFAPQGIRAPAYPAVYPPVFPAAYQPFAPKNPVYPVNAPVQPADQNKKKPAETPNTEWLGRVVVVVAAVAVTVAVAYLLYEVACYISEIVRDKFSKDTDADLEMKARQKGLGHMVDKVKQISSINSRQVLKRLAACKEHEERIFRDLEDRFVFSVDHLKEMLMGAHIRLEDKGVIYGEWKMIDCIKRRMSSHASDGEQFSIKGSLIKEMLCGDISENGRKYTWYQLENHPVSFGSIARHMIDYVKYKISSANQGPYGSSSITDKKPLYIAARAA